MLVNRKSFVVGTGGATSACHHFPGFSNSSGIKPGPIQNGKRRYRAQVWVMQHTDDGNYPDISLWTHNGTTPPPVLTVEEARTLGYALLQAAELVDRERDTAIRQFLDNTP